MIFWFFIAVAVALAVLSFGMWLLDMVRDRSEPDDDGWHPRDE